jgi:hypothetical protein
LTYATDHTTCCCLFRYLHLATYSVDPAHEKYQFPPEDSPLRAETRECDSVNKVVLTYISALVGFLRKMLSCNFAYWKKFILTYDYTWAHSYSKSQLIYKRPLYSFPICAYITTYSRRLVLYLYFNCQLWVSLDGSSIPHNFGLLPSLLGGRMIIYTHIGTNCTPFSIVSFFVLILWKVIESEFTVRNWKIVRHLKTTIKPSPTTVHWTNVEHQNQ